METEQIQLDLKKLNNEFSKKFRDYYIYCYDTRYNSKKIIWGANYNIELELDIIKRIWKDVFYTECRKIIESYSKNKNVNEDRVKKFYDEHFKKYENAWEINYQESDLEFFSKLLRREKLIHRKSRLTCQFY